MKKSIKKAGIAVLVLAIIAVGSAFAQQSKITVKGSDTMVILAQKWENYI